MNEFRRQHSAVAIGNKVLITGGVGLFTQPDPNVGRPTFADVLRSAELYDPKTRSFKRVGNLNRARYGHASVRLFDGTILVVGGYDDQNHPVLEMEVYHPTTESFSILQNSRAPSGSYVNAVKSGRVIIFAGGNRGTGALQEVWAYCYESVEGVCKGKDSDNFRRLSDLKQAREGWAASTAIGPIIILGGGNYPGIEIYEPDGNGGKGASYFLGDVDTGYSTTVVGWQRGDAYQFFWRGGRAHTTPNLERASILTLVRDATGSWSHAWTTITPAEHKDGTFHGKWRDAQLSVYHEKLGRVLVLGGDAWEQVDSESGTNQFRPSASTEYFDLPPGQHPSSSSVVMNQGRDLNMSGHVYGTVTWNSIGGYVLIAGGAAHGDRAGSDNVSDFSNIAEIYTTNENECNHLPVPRGKAGVFIQHTRRAGTNRF